MGGGAKTGQGGGSREKAGSVGNLDWWPAQRKELGAGEGKGTEEWGRAQQLSLRGDRCFLMGVLGPHPPWGLVGS